jgi:RND family efflux transporter MFP subunit
VTHGTRRLVLPLLLVAAAAASACSKREEAAERPRAAVSAASAPTATEVTTALVRRGPILPRVTAPGSLFPMRESQIGAEVMGRLEHVFVSVGDRVEEGQPLFQIDPASYQAALAQAEAGLRLAAAQRALTESDLARLRLLQERDYAPKQQVEKLETALEVARAQERQAKEQVEMARLQLSRTLVRAPFAGSVAQRLADEGTTALAQPQTVVIVLQETATLEARVAIPEAQLSLVRPGDAAQLYVQGLPEAVETHVFAVSDSIDPTTRTYLVRMRVPNPDRTLKAGVFARVEIVAQSLADAVLVPRDAVRTEDGESRVYAVQDGIAVAMPVRLGVVTQDSAQVLSGVEPGAEVIVGESARTIAPGMRVRPRSAAAEDKTGGGAAA